MTDLARATPTGLAGFDGATVTSTSLRLVDDVTDERILEIARIVGKVSRAGGWWVGDLVTQADARDHDLATRTADETGWGEGTILSWMKICRSIAPEDRNEMVSISAHFELLNLYLSDRDAYLAEMAELDAYREQYGKNLGHRDLREKLRAKYGDDRLPGEDWRSEEERLSDALLEVAALTTELEDLRVTAGTHVRCPRCNQVHPVQDARVRVPTTDDQLA